jgi:hypothetical protein
MHPLGRAGADSISKSIAQRWWTELLLPKIHVRSTLAIGSVTTIIFGNLSIIMGFKDDGFIDIKSAIIEGHIRTGAIGVLVVFLGIVTSLALIVSYVGKKRTVEYEIDGIGKVRITGVTHMRETIQYLTEMHNLSLQLRSQRGSSGSARNGQRSKPRVPHARTIGGDDGAQVEHPRPMLSDQPLDP